MSTLYFAQSSAFFRPSPRAFPSKSAVPTVRMQTCIHSLIQEHDTVLMPGCYDAISAAIVQKAGFSAGFISRYALSASLLGKPDFGLLTSVVQSDRYIPEQSQSDACSCCMTMGK